MYSTKEPLASGVLPIGLSPPPPRHLRRPIGAQAAQPSIKIWVWQFRPRSAKRAIDDRAEMGLAPLGRENPRSDLPWGIMPEVLTVAAG